MLLETDMSSYRLFMEAHLMKFNEAHLALTSSKPEVDEATLDTLLSTTKQPTAASRAYLAKVESEAILWTHRVLQLYY